jgi:hypothetical protein
MEKSKRFWTASPGRGSLLGAVALAGAGLAGGGDARGRELQDPVRFLRALGGSSCTDGANPVAGVVRRRPGSTS